MAAMLSITWESDSVPVPVLHLKGRLDAEGSVQLCETVRAFLRQTDQPDLVVDLAGLEFVASTGLATFLLLTEEFVEIHGTIVFANAIPTVMQVLSLLNIDQFLTLATSEEAAFGMIGA